MRTVELDKDTGADGAAWPNPAPTIRVSRGPWRTTQMAWSPRRLATSTAAIVCQNHRECLQCSPATAADMPARHRPSAQDRCRHHRYHRQRLWPPSPPGSTWQVGSTRSSSASQRCISAAGCPTQPDPTPGGDDQENRQQDAPLSASSGPIRFPIQLHKPTQRARAE
jgi:hypothetical protein